MNEAELGNHASCCTTLTSSACGGARSISRFAVHGPAYRILRLIECALTLEPQHRARCTHVPEKSRDGLRIFHVYERSTATATDADVNTKAGYKFTESTRVTLAAAEKFQMIAVRRIADGAASEERNTQPSAPATDTLGKWYVVRRVYGAMEWRQSYRPALASAVAGCAWCVDIDTGDMGCSDYRSGD